MFHKNIQKTSVFLFAITFSMSYATVADYRVNNAQVIGAMNSISQKAPLSYNFSKDLEKANSAEPYSFSEEEILSFISSALAIGSFNGIQQERDFLANTKSALMEQLRAYKVSGVCFDIDPNLAFIIETQNPDLCVKYCDSNGNVKTRRYRARINTLGFKFEASIKLDLIFFTDTNLNFYDSDKTIEIGTGIDMNLSFAGGIALTYAPFINAPGGLIIISIPLFFAFPSLSVVTGGTLTPAL